MENNQQGLDDRQLGIWRALFEFAQRVGADDPVNVNQSSLQQLSEEDRKWLESAMSQFSNESDHIKKMSDEIQVLITLDLYNPGQEDKNQGLASLEILKDMCEHIDYASDFYKIGGFRLLTPLLSSSYAPFRASAAELIGHITQNHAYCQEKLNNSVLKILCELLDKDMDDDVKLKALYGISSLIRGNKQNQEAFHESNGLSYILKALLTENPKLRMKSVFLLSWLLKEPDVKDAALSMGMVDQLISMLNDQNDQMRELATAALLALVDNYTEAIEECRRPELSLRDILLQRLGDIENNLQFKDEAEMCRCLIEQCWPDCDLQR